MLTQREMDVYKLKQKGLRQEDIARKLSISQPAISKFYNNALKKITEAKEILNFIKEVKNVK